jgi:uncharacterized protein
MRKPLFIALALALAAAAPAAAQPEPSASEMEAVRELLEVSRTRETFIRSMELGMEQGSGGQLPPEVKQVLREFLDEHFRYEDLEPEFIRLYADLYTEEELRGMTAFYRTPIGQRVIATSPDLAVGSQRIAQERLQAVMPQLMELLMQAMDEDEEEDEDPPAGSES